MRETKLWVCDICGKSDHQWQTTVQQLPKAWQAWQGGTDRFMGSITSIRIVDACHGPAAPSEWNLRYWGLPPKEREFYDWLANIELAEGTPDIDYFEVIAKAKELVL